MRLGDLDRTHRRRKIAARAHPVPDLVQVAPQIFLELRHGLPVHPGRAAVLLDPLERRYDQALRDVKGLSCRRRLLHQRLLPDLPVDRTNKPQVSPPLRSAPITGASPLLRAGPPARPATVLSGFRSLPSPRSLPPPATPAGNCVRAHLPAFRAKAADRA